MSVWSKCNAQESSVIRYQGREDQSIVIQMSSVGGGPVTINIGVQILCEKLMVAGRMVKA